MKLTLTNTAVVVILDEDTGAPIYNPVLILPGGSLEVSVDAE